MPYKVKPMNQKQENKMSGPPKWVIIVAVLLMLLGMATYLLTLDESIQPEPLPQQTPNTPSLPVQGE
jgi:hypothetical protein